MIKYRVYANSRDNVMLRVDIYSKQYDGEIIEFRGVESRSFELFYNGIDEPMKEPIISSRASISFYIDDTADIEEIQLVNDLDMAVKAYRDDELFWSGYLISDGLEERISAGYREVSVSAVDGIKSMEGKILEVTNPRGIDMGSYLSDVRCPMNIIRQCFNTINNILPIRWKCDTVSELNTDKDVLAGELELSKRGELLAFKEVDAYWLLSGILKSFNLTCVQIGAIWHIVDIQHLIKNNGIISLNEIPASMDNVKARTVVVDFNKDLKGRELMEDAYMTTLKPIGQSIIKYDSTHDDNVLPNGNMNIQTSGSILYWDLAYGSGYTTTDEPINGRTVDKWGNVEHSLRFDNLNTIGDSAISFYDDLKNNYITIDSNVLYKQLTLGLTFMPKRFPEKIIDGVKLIDWDKEPLKMEVTYTIERDGNILTYYLNENGYWNTDRSGGLVFIKTQRVTTGWRHTFSGAGKIGQVLEFYESITPSNSPNIMTVVLPQDFNSTKETLEWVLSQYPQGGNIFNDTAIELNYKTANNVVRVKLHNDGAVLVNYIPFIVDKMANEDIVRVNFTSKGNQGKVLMPNLGEIGYVGAGRLSMKLITYKNSIVNFDDVYINVDVNNDVYDSKLDNNNGKYEDELKISSGFTGFLLSSYGDSFATIEDSMMFTRNGKKATLTEHFANDVLRWRYRPLKEVTCTSDGMITPLSICSFYGRKLMPLSRCEFNHERNTTALTMFEIEDKDVEITTTYYGSNDDKNS